MIDLTVANTIREQIGSKALYMLGAKNFVGSNNGLMFRIYGSLKVSHIKIELNANDLYDVTFLKCRKTGIVANKTFKNIGVDKLHKLIEENTNLNLKLF